MIDNATIPSIEVGILFSPIIRFRLNGIFTDRATGRQYSGEYSICRDENGAYRLDDTLTEVPLIFEPDSYEQCDFDLLDVTIGIHFHWERKENQKFKGCLKIIDEGTYLTAVNKLILEDYLLSAISSEMNAGSPVELLKAHAVISRSWLLAQKEKELAVKDDYISCTSSDTSYIRWYDREDHAHFDVCADDHCQRYQGISKAYTPAVKDAVGSTSGEVITYNRRICDARFSKCCGGISERFDNTWEPVEHPYLTKVVDADHPISGTDLTDETEARRWIYASPDVFCNTGDDRILSTVLNDYDRETRHFFRWMESYQTDELSALVRKRLGIDFGTITGIIPVERGVSGRIIYLKIIGTKKTMTIGKELTIRRAFSESHLYSSAFVVEKIGAGFIFKGAGWGHGVGLCQIGAAVMATKGYNYKEILTHYFKGSHIEKKY